MSVSQDVSRVGPLRSTIDVAVIVNAIGPSTSHAFPEEAGVDTLA